jgi:hypothetical protein
MTSRRRRRDRTACRPQLVVDLAPMTRRISGKSILGGLLGGTLGTEIGEKAIDWREPTGDA